MELVKILVVGDTWVGKTSLLREYVHGSFPTDYQATLGVQFHTKELGEELCGGSNGPRLMFWDIQGQDRVRSMTRIFYRDAVAALVVFDWARVGTLWGCSEWKRDIDSKVTQADGTPLPCILIGNKSDLERDPSMPSEDAIDAFAEREGFRTWASTSAKERYGLARVVPSLLRMLRRDGVLSPSLSSSESSLSTECLFDTASSTASLDSPSSGSGLCKKSKFSLASRCGSARSSQSKVVLEAITGELHSTSSIGKSGGARCGCV